MIGYYDAPDGENEALFVADRIQKFLSQESSSKTQNRGAGHCAVLYRTNAQSRLFEEALRRYNISYAMVGGFSFYERAEIKDLLGYLRLICNPHDSMALQRVINTPAPASVKQHLKLWNGWLSRPAPPPGMRSPPPFPTASSPPAR